MSVKFACFLIPLCLTWESQLGKTLKVSKFTDDHAAVSCLGIDDHDFLLVYCEFNLGIFKPSYTLELPCTCHAKETLILFSAL